jgi:hypothetical protein
MYGLDCSTPILSRSHFWRRHIKSEKRYLFPTKTQPQLSLKTFLADILVIASLFFLVISP